MNHSLEHPDSYDVIVIGGGHAGTEAALASARTGARTLLLTVSIEAIGQMSCNPAIGGIGKTHLVREIDALGGAMARATDAAGIQFRVLNARKGPAVRATRAQTDRALYRAAIRRIVDAQPNLEVFQQAVTDLVIEGDAVRGVVTGMGLTFRARAVVLTTGTFLGGRIHIGLEQHAGGRAGDAPSNALAERLRALPLRVGRLKTGTPPRIDGKTVDFSVMTPQPGDEPRPVMSFLGSRDEHPEQVPCWITRTTAETHEIIRGGLDRSPMYSGVIEGAGPRYCPSVEDKVVRFADKDSHQIFVEPEGLDTHELYPNGISTSLPFDVQIALVRSIPGFEQAHITRPGYAIEYDYFDPRDLSPSLETKVIEGLYFAGQINGTTGYEEAGAQGLLAGLNASRSVAGLAPWTPRRDEAYLGVLVDDLIRLGTAEPYRMFTSRAEFRLLLRQDNADLRLTGIGHELGLVDDERRAHYEARRAAVADGRARLEGVHVQPGSDLAQRITAATGEAIDKETSLDQVLRRPDVAYVDLLAALDETGVSEDVTEQIEVQIKYEGYIARQQVEIERLRRHEETALPEDLDYGAVGGLSNEVRQKLEAARPDTLARASRIPGVTPAAVSQLLIHLKKARGAGPQRVSVAQAAELGERLQRRLLAVGAPDAPAVVDRLLRWLELHARWSRIGNLTGTRDTDTLVDLHLTDAAALHGLLPGGMLLDIGSGSGLPGLVLACLDPRRELILLDAAQKRTRFLEQAALELGLDAVRVVTARCEDHAARLAKDGPRPDAMIARAVAPLARLAEWTRPLLDAGVPFFAQKGPAWAEEAEALPPEIEVRSVRTYALPDVERDHVLVCMAARTAVTPEDAVPATDAGEQGE